MINQISQQNTTEFVNYLNAIASDKLVDAVEMQQISTKFDKKIQKIYRTQLLQLPQTSKSDAIWLKECVIHHNHSDIARILQKLIIEQDIQKKHEESSCITKNLEFALRRARPATELAPSQKTTNPIEFLSDQRLLAPYVPKEGKIIGVFKSKFGQSLSPSALNQLFNALSEHLLGNSTDLALKETIKTCIPFTSYKEGEDEELIESLKKAFAEDIDQAGAEAKEMWKKTTLLDTGIGNLKESLLMELRQKNVVARAFAPLENRFINTALLATLYDDVCGTDLFPPASKITVPGKGAGFIQEGMVYIPLLTNKSDEEATPRLEALSHFIDLESYQRAVLRSTEMADADLHAGNVALIPKMGDRILPEFLKFKPGQLNQLLNALHQYRNLGFAADTQTLQKLIADTQAEKLILAIAEVKNMTDLNSDQLQAVFNQLKEEFHFDIKLYDVDLTMPKSNTKGVTGGKVPVRNMLMALPLANIPLTDGVKSEIKWRQEHIKPLDQFIKTKFNENEYVAWQARVARLNNAINQPDITARGALWKVIPIYGEMEEYIKELAARYEKIKTQANTFPPNERKQKIKELEIEEFIYPPLAEEAKNRYALQQQNEGYYNYDLLGYQYSLDPLVDYMEADKKAGRFKPMHEFPISL